MTTQQIIEALGIENSSDSFKAQIVSKIMATADLRFARIIDDIMTEEEREQFEQFSEGKGPEDIARWVEEKYEGAKDAYTDIVRSIVTDLKNQEV